MILRRERVGTHMSVYEYALGQEGNRPVETGHNTHILKIHLSLSPALSEVSTIQPPSTGWRPVRRPLLTRERLIAQRRAMRWKAFDEMLIKPFLNSQDEVTYQAKVRQMSKSVTGSGDLKISSFGTKFLQILLNEMERKWLSSCLILSSGKCADQVTKGHHTQNTYMRGVEHVLWDILHEEYDVDGCLAILAHLGETRYTYGQVKVRSKRSNSKFSIWTNKDIILMQKVPEIPWCHLFFCTWIRTSKNCVWLH